MADKNPNLASLEEVLREAIKANYYLNSDDLSPERVVDEIASQLEKSRFEWVDSTVYVPNLLVISVPGGSPDKMEELEVLFNSVVFMKYLYEYMTEQGYKLFDFVRIDIEPANPSEKELRLKFYWSTPEQPQDEFTVLLNEEDKKIVEVFAPKAEIPQLARLTALNAETYRVTYVIKKQTTYIGRLRNVIDKESHHMFRRNDFVFARHLDPMSINSSVSRLHAKISFIDNKFVLFDTGSANGTSISRGVEDVETIELPRAEIQGEILNDGDIINLGSAQIKFELISHDEASGIASMPASREPEELVDDSTSDTTYRHIKLSEVQSELSKLEEN